MKNYGSVSDPKDIVTKEYVDGKATASATIANGVMSFKDASGTVLYTITLPVYNGSVT